MQRWGAAFAVITIGVTACGGSTRSERKALTQAYTRYENALAAKDPAAVCRLISPADRTLLLRQVGGVAARGSCPTAMAFVLRQGGGDDPDWNKAKHHLAEIWISRNQAVIRFGARGTRKFDFSFERFAGVGWLFTSEVKVSTRTG
jgi:hypothetical protein